MNEAPTEAMVLAAGLGTRMRPLTQSTPKPLIQVAGKSLLDYVLDQFAEAGVTNAIVNVHYLADQIENHLGNRKAPQIKISDERALLLETGGGLLKALPHFSGDAIYCTNTDAIFVDPQIAKGLSACQALAKNWDAERMDALLLLAPIANTTGYDGAGDFDLNTDGTLAFRSQESAAFVFTGLQIISKELVKEGPDGPFSTNILWRRASERGRLHGVTYDGEWMHVGDPEGLEIAQSRLQGRKP